MFYLSFPSTVVREQGDYVFTFADLPEVVTGDPDPEDAYRLAKDALDEAVLARLANDEAIPELSERDGDQIWVPLEPLTAARVAFDRARRGEGLSKVATAARIGKDEKVVRRILDGTGVVRLETVLEGLAALGCTAVVGVTRPSDLTAKLRNLGQA